MSFKLGVFSEVSEIVTLPKLFVSIAEEVEDLFCLELYGSTTCVGSSFTTSNSYTSSSIMQIDSTSVFSLLENEFNLLYIEHRAHVWKLDVCSHVVDV